MQPNNWEFVLRQKKNRWAVQQVDSGFLADSQISSIIKCLPIWNGWEMWVVDKKYRTGKNTPVFGTY